MSFESRDFLSVTNIDDMDFSLEIKKFLPKRCIPNFEFSNKYYELSNSNIWGNSILGDSD